MVWKKNVISGHDVDEAITFSDWKFFADLANDLKCIDVGRGSMFNDADHKYWQVTRDIIGK